MGMDVSGKKASSPEGEYFRNNVWWWRPLWTYCCDIGREVISDEIAGACHMNEGEGLDATGAVRLADILEAEIASGRTQEHEDEYEAQRAAIPKETCEHCSGTGIRDDWARPCRHNTKGAEDHPSGKKVIYKDEHAKMCKGCNACGGEGKKESFASCYPFSTENVQEFAAFLRYSGGFKVW